MSSGQGGIMQKYKRPSRYPGIRSIPLKNSRTVAWHKYVPSNRVPGGPTEDDIRFEKTPVLTKLDGKRPNPVGEITKDCFGGPGKQLSYAERDDYRRLRIQFQGKTIKLWLFYNSRDCYFICECHHSYIRYTSKLYYDRKKALLTSVEEIDWIKAEPFTRGGD